jgi:DNA-binding MarR family transcriptional regulator
METPENDFLLGSLLGIPADALAHEVYTRFVRDGFKDVRALHLSIFRLLPPQGCRVTELARRLYTTKQAMGYLVDYLVEQGYLERIPDPTDGRAQIVRRTERGWQINQLARRYVLEIQEEWTKKFGQEKMQNLLTLLRELVHDVLGVSYQGSIPEESLRKENKKTSSLSF